MNKIENYIDRTCPVFRKIKLIFVQEIYFENCKCQISDKFASSCLKRYKKILWGNSFGCKKTIETHLPHYEIQQPSPH